MSIAKVPNQYYNGKRGQIRRKHSIRDFLSIEDVRVDHVCSDDNLVYLLMKGLTREKVYKTSKDMRLNPLEL